MTTLTASLMIVEGIDLNTPVYHLLQQAISSRDTRVSYYKINLSRLLQLPYDDATPYFERYPISGPRMMGIGGAVGDVLSMLEPE